MKQCRQIFLRQKGKTNMSFGRDNKWCERCQKIHYWYHCDHPDTQYELTRKKDDCRFGSKYKHEKVKKGEVSDDVSNFVCRPAVEV